MFTFPSCNIDTSGHLLHRDISSSSQSCTVFSSLSRASTTSYVLYADPNYSSHRTSKIVTGSREAETTTLELFLHCTASSWQRCPESCVGHITTVYYPQTPSSVTYISNLVAYPALSKCASAKSTSTVLRHKNDRL